MDPDKEFNLSVRSLAMFIFLAAGLFLSLWLRPPEGFEDSYVALGAGIFFLILGIATVTFIKTRD